MSKKKAAPKPASKKRSIKNTQSRTLLQRMAALERDFRLLADIFGKRIVELELTVATMATTGRPVEPIAPSAESKPTDDEIAYGQEDHSPDEDFDESLNDA